MTYADHTAAYRRFQGALVCEQLRRQIAVLNAQLSEAEGRLDEEIARRQQAEKQLARERLAHPGYLAATTPGKSRAKG